MVPRGGCCAACRPACPWDGMPEQCKDASQARARRAGPGEKRREDASLAPRRPVPFCQVGAFVEEAAEALKEAAAAAAEEASATSPAEQAASAASVSADLSQAAASLEQAAQAAQGNTDVVEAIQSAVAAISDAAATAQVGGAHGAVLTAAGSGLREGCFPPAQLPRVVLVPVPRGRAARVRPQTCQPALRLPACRVLRSQQSQLRSLR